ncbi:hypothetical protein BN1708_015754 [Verticillium longisporum]|uniref:Uncharacterized protein n=1 Tax=Verticillium longisporum TaxID=100787 RepID=A0A0G4M818_VERLO|nr:hypothetical protein BN1708_015754 [Verticillium longisporum]
MSDVIGPGTALCRRHVLAFLAFPGHRFRRPNDPAVHSYDRQMTDGSRASKSSSGINCGGAANGNPAVWPRG